MVNLLALGILVIAIYLAYRLYKQRKKEKQPEIFYDFYKDVQKSLEYGSKKSKPEGDYKLILEGNRKKGIKPKELGKLTGVTTVRSFRTMNYVSEEQKNLLIANGYNVIEEKIDDPDKKRAKITRYRIDENIEYYVLTYKTSIIGKTKPLLVPVEKVSAFASTTILFGETLKVDPTGKFLVLQWEDKEPRYQHLEMKLVHEELYSAMFVQEANELFNILQKTARRNPQFNMEKDLKKMDL